MTGRVDEVMEPTSVDELNRLVAERHPQIHVYCPSGDAVGVMRFTPVALAVNTLTHGRSVVQSFTVEAPQAD